MDKLERVLGLDIGTKRIGVAISDPLGIFSRELELVERKSDKYAVDRILKLCEEYAVKTVVAGVPYNMDGSLGSQAQNCIDFAKLLEPRCKIEFIDESLTSFEAEELLKKENVRYTKRSERNGKKVSNSRASKVKERSSYTKNKGLVDLKSACLILSEYLNSRR